jgi:hypothetical protein
MGTPEEMAAEEYFAPPEAPVTAVATIAVKPEQDPRVLALAEEANSLLKYATTRTVASNEDLTPATEDLSIIAKVKKALNEAKSTYVKPIRGYLDEVNAAFNLIMKPLEEADKITRQKIMAYRQEVQRREAEAAEINRQKEELARREAAFSGTGEVTIDTTPVEAPALGKHVCAGGGTLLVAKSTTWELVDFAQVPDQYKMLDTGKINKVVKAGGTIPGIKVIETESLRVRPRG